MSKITASNIYGSCKKCNGEYELEGEQGPALPDACCHKDICDNKLKNRQHRYDLPDTGPWTNYV